MFVDVPISVQTPPICTAYTIGRYSFDGVVFSFLAHRFNTLPKSTVSIVLLTKALSMVTGTIMRSRADG